MITAVDTNILLDVLIPDPDHMHESEVALGDALRNGALIISEPVYAEIAVQFEQKPELDRFLSDSNVHLTHSTQEALHVAGEAWARYSRRRPPRFFCPECGAAQDMRCNQCGKQIATRQHLITDFLIGAHALSQADKLLSRDVGYYRTYFADLVVESP